MMVNTKYVQVLINFDTSRYYVAGQPHSFFVKRVGALVLPCAQARNTSVRNPLPTLDRFTSVHSSLQMFDKCVRVSLVRLRNICIAISGTTQNG